MARVHRPYQYLGSKLRALDAIIDVAGGIRTKGAVLDIFTGSSVVAQAFAAGGRRVYASDALCFSSEVASAMLGVSRRADDPTADEIIIKVQQLRDDPWREAWQEWVVAESKALRDRDFELLEDLYLRLPTAWRSLDSEPTVLTDVRAAAGGLGEGSLPLMTAFYAGTYFGISQALDLDGLRRAIWILAREMGDAWPIRVLHAALLGAASDAVFSAGKHYAQPMALRGEHSRARVWIDRDVSVTCAFERGVRRIYDAARPRGEGHRSYCRSLERWPEHIQEIADVGLVYADPPYTAQQYSRFYHIPETLFTQRVPELQVCSGELTRGLYPIDRHASRFCRKTEALSAFSDLMALASQLGSALAISYSEAGRISGNDRMVSIADIKHIAGAHLPDSDVQVIELAHQYRQFNNRKTVARDNGGREYLMVIS